MITTCTGCQARFRLDADKVPHRKIRVRCPDCAAVFDLDGNLRDEPVTLAPAAGVGLEAPTAPEPAVTPAPSLGQALQSDAPVSAPEPGDLQLEPTSAAASVDRKAAPAGQPAAPASGVAVAEAPAPGRRRRRDKSEMLARALVSDILVYNREARDKALADGNLLKALGPEIKKSWELYKEKVGAEAATGSNHFKDALNEILAEGQSLF